MATISKYQTASGATLYRVRYRTRDRGQTDKRGFKTKRDAEQWLSDKLSPSMVTTVYSVLARILDDAVRDDDDLTGVAQKLDECVGKMSARGQNGTV